MRVIGHFGADIASTARIAYNARLSGLENISIGQGSIISYRCELAAWGRIEIGKNVIISPYSTVLTGSHDVQTEEYGNVVKSVLVEDYVWIAYRCIILPGVKIGYGAVVGAGSVVTKDVEPWSIVAGNPARHVKWRPERTLTYVPVSWK